MASVLRHCADAFLPIARRCYTNCMVKGGAALLAAIFLAAFFPSAFGARTSDAENLYELSPSEFRNAGPAQDIIEPGRVNYEVLNAAIIFEVNSVRRANGIVPLLYSGALERAASIHSKDMAEYDFFSHTNPRDRMKRTPAMRLASCGVKAFRIAENIATAFALRYDSGKPVIPLGREGSFADPRTGVVLLNHSYVSLAKSVVSDWMNSPGHRANILDRKLKYSGAGTYGYKESSFNNATKFMITLDLSSDRD